MGFTYPPSPQFMASALAIRINCQEEILDLPWLVLAIWYIHRHVLPRRGGGPAVGSKGPGSLEVILNSSTFFGSLYDGFSSHELHRLLKAL